MDGMAFALPMARISAQNRSEAIHRHQVLSVREQGMIGTRPVAGRWSGSVPRRRFTNTTNRESQPERVSVLQAISFELLHFRFRTKITDHQPARLTP